MTTATEFDEIKKKQQLIWSSGDYGKVAWVTVPLAETLCEAVDPRPGSAVLDVATGTGHVALGAARRFCHAIGVDYVPALIDTAGKRAVAEGLPVEFREADAENLPFDDASFDYALSAIGVMFTANHQRAADELARVCKPGGRIGLASWTPSGFVGRMLKTVGGHAPPPPGSLPPPRWGSEEALREMFGNAVSALECTTMTITQRFTSPEHFADFFLTHYGPTLKASQRLDEDGQHALRTDMIALAAESNRATDGTCVMDWEYLIAVGTRA